MTEDLESEIAELNEEKREEFEDRIEAERARLERELREEHKQKIKNQTDDDEDELQDFNIIISAFLNREETDYTFIRTEPLYHEGEKNFDVLIASGDKGIAVFIECERSLISDLSRKLSEFFAQTDVIKDNTPGGLDVGEYLSKTIGSAPNEKEYVISSKQLSDEKLTDEAESKGRSFIAWDLTPAGNKCKIRYHIAKESTTATLDGHEDDDLMDYISNVLLSGIDYQTYIDFTYSSSKYSKIENMVLVIVNRHQRKGNDTFDYVDWKRLFRIELSNYREEEKETLFRNFVDYGRDCGVVDLDEDLGSIVDNRYRIRSRATKDQESLVTEVRNKMTKFEMRDELEDQLRDKKEELVTELKRDQATGGTTLADFADDNDDN